MTAASHRLRTRLVALSVILPLFGAACGRRAVFVPPVSAGVPVPDAQALWAPVAAACRSTMSYRAAFGLTGVVGDRRIRGLASARLNTALSAAGDIGLEATVSGQLLFRLGGNAEKAVLLLRDGNRVATARPEEILEALIGVRIAPERLLAIVTGCVTRAEAVDRAFRYEALLQLVAGDVTVYLEPAGASWRVRAGTFGDVTVDYGRLANGLPGEFRIQSTAAGRPIVSLDLRVEAVQTNSVLDDTLFRVTLPEGAAPISLDELREAGPLGEEPAAR